MNELTRAQETKTPKWFQAALLTGMLVFAFYASTHMSAAGDTWVGMACGRHFDSHGVDTVEPFSFNSHPAGPSDTTLEKYPVWTHKIIKKWHPTGWINQNWLTHLIFYKCARWFGDGNNYNYNTLVYWKFIIYFLAVMAVYATGRAMGAGAFLSSAGACFAMFIGRTFFDIRPAGYSNLLVPVLILLLALTVYRNYLLIWLLVPMVVFWANVHGGYLYAFIMLVPFVGIHLLLRLPRRWSICTGLTALGLVLYLMSYKFISNNVASQMSLLFVFVTGGLLVLATALKKDRFIALPVKGIYHTIGAGITAFIAMIIFNPFHLTNLTHTFEISVSRHAASWRQVGEWRPAFDWMDKTTKTPNPAGHEEAFAVLCILTGAALLLWMIAQFLKPKSITERDQRSRPQDIPTETFKWPKIDLAIIVISLLTLYMAIRSRRFIAFAGSAAAPIVFLMILQSRQMFSAWVRWKRTGILRPTPLNPVIQQLIRYGVVLVILGLGIFWGMKYKRIYLGPWPKDARYNNVFMRMTASHLKPFGACQFINDNNISGHVFNYWTDGGAVSFGQDPDPATGQIPLKVFMDGRAQAAYDHDTFLLWQTIFSGGPPAQKAMAQCRIISPTQMEEVAAWIDKSLKLHDIHVVLMPRSQKTSFFTRALEQTANWKTAYMDNVQHLLVNIETPEGKDLIDKVLNDKAVFPDTHSKNITLSTAILENKYEQRYDDVYPLLKSAFQEYPHPSSIRAMTRLIRSPASPALKPEIIAGLEAFLDDFVRQQDTYRRQDGYFHRLESAKMSAQFLAQTVQEDKEQRAGSALMFKDELNSLTQASEW